MRRRFDFEEQPITAAVRIRSPVGDPVGKQALAEAKIRGDFQQWQVSSHASSFSFVQIVMHASRYRPSMPEPELTGNITMPHYNAYNHPIAWAERSRFHAGAGHALGAPFRIPIVRSTELSPRTLSNS